MPCPRAPRIKQQLRGRRHEDHPSDRRCKGWVRFWPYPLALLVLFLELGAPNQPGGILVGTLIIITYLNLPGMLRMAIYLEVLLGSAQNLINVISNIVTVVEDEGIRMP